MTRTTAVVTIVYNEPVFLPIWIKYYAGQFGESACYVVDHGTDDGSTDRLGEVNRVSIPRSPVNNRKRAKFISEFCSALLEWYDVVIYCDVDELLVPDPEVYSSLKDLTENTPATTIRAIGLNVTHIPDLDPVYDVTRPVLDQRRWGRFAFAMCKPLITRQPIRWTPGFHSCNLDASFDHLFLFHLHHVDLGLALVRLAKTRVIPRSDGPADHYHRWSDEKHEQVARAIARLPRISGCSFRDDDPVLGPYVTWINDFLAAHPEKRDLFYYQNGISCNELLEIPQRFTGMV